MAKPDSFESGGGKWLRWLADFVAAHWKVLLPLILSGTLAAGVTTGRITAPTCPDCPPCFECPTVEQNAAECVLKIDRCLDWISDGGE